MNNEFYNKGVNYFGSEEVFHMWIYYKNTIENSGKKELTEKQLLENLNNLQ